MNDTGQSAFSRRFVAGSTMAIDPAKIEHSKRMITRFQKKILNYLFRNKLITTHRNSISGEMIRSAYENRKSEIESLRKYDRGEKEIVAQRLKTLSKCI